MIIDKDVEVKINGRNREQYEEIAKKKLKNGDLILINQNLVLSHASVIIDCTCDMCGKIFSTNRRNITNSIVCSKKCRSNYRRNWMTLNNPNPTKEQLKTSCANCDKEMLLDESVFKRNKYHLCSRHCYKEHRKKTYHSDKIYNYQDIKTPCITCGELIKTSEWYIKNKTNQFCSQECYWVHREVYYIDFYYQGGLNDSRPETIPESKVREWLESKGFVKNIDFYQEYDLFKTYFADFYIPKYNTVIEVYGDYWHVNPNVYDVYENNPSKKRMNDYQRQKVSTNSDFIRQRHIEHNGYNFKFLWEKDLKEDTEEHITNLFCQIIKESVTTTRNAPSLMDEDIV